MIPRSLITGEVLRVRNPLEKARCRMARMRVRVWYGILGLQTALEGGTTRLIMFTLTYKNLDAWEPRHVSHFAHWLRTEGCKGYVWVAEMQKRGAVHYHVLALFDKMHRWSKPSTENGAWAEGFTWVTDDIQKPFYIMKYLQKGEVNGKLVRFPKGLRLYGISRGAIHYLEGENALRQRGSLLPHWFRSNEEAVSTFASARRVSGGIEYNGRLAISPYSGEKLATVREVEYDMYHIWHFNLQVPQG